MILFLVQGVIRNGIINYRNGYGKSIIDFPGKHSNIYSYMYKSESNALSYTCIQILSPCTY